MEFDASHEEEQPRGPTVFDVRRRRAQSGKRARSEKQKGEMFRGIML
jgi:hypothetical protein